VVSGGSVTATGLVNDEIGKWVLVQSHATFLHQTLDVYLPSVQTNKQERPDYGDADLGASQKVHKPDGPRKHKLRDTPFAEAA